jgi:hypothetical protein
VTAELKPVAQERAVLEFYAASVPAIGDAAMPQT